MFRFSIPWRCGSRSFCRRLSCLAVEQRLPRDGVVLDLTLGDGEHSAALLASTGCSVVATDCDPASASVLGRLSAEFGSGRFHGEVSLASGAAAVLRRSGKRPSAVAVMMDMGPSRRQRGQGRERGLELRVEGRLDGRYCREEGLGLAEVLESLQQDRLSHVLKVYGGVVGAREVAAEVVERRYLLEKVVSTQHLLELLERVHTRKGEVWEERGLEAAMANMDKAFLALRRFVNDEVNEMVHAIQMAELVLEPGEYSLDLNTCSSSKLLPETQLKEGNF